MPSLYGGSAPAQMVRTPGTAGPVQNLLAAPGAIYGANLTTALPSLVLMDAGAGGAYIARTAVAITATLAASEAQDTAAIAVTFGGITAVLAASEAQDVAAIAVTFSGGPTEQFTVSGPHVTDIFTTSTLSYPYDIKKRTA